jgi:hypothetical protein
MTGAAVTTAVGVGAGAQLASWIARRADRTTSVTSFFIFLSP